VECLVLNEETLKTDVEARVGAQIAKVGFGKAMKNKWVSVCGDKKEKVKRIQAEVQDDDCNQLKAYLNNTSIEAHDKKNLDLMKKRQLLTIVTIKTFKADKGEMFQPTFVKLPSALTADMLRSGAWKKQ
jgi:phenylalanyl-tRNA synthetase alpha chain